MSLHVPITILFPRPDRPPCLLYTYSSMSEPCAKRRKSSSNQRQSHTRRSVLGCLTCRRRKVKCDGQTAPCANCRRLRLDCTPSFHTNFKSWISSNATASGVSGAVNALASPPPEETSAQDHPEPTSLAASGNTSPPVDSLSSPREPSESVGNAGNQSRRLGSPPLDMGQRREHKFWRFCRSAVSLYCSFFRYEQPIPHESRCSHESFGARVS